MNTHLSTVPRSRFGLLGYALWSAQLAAFPAFDLVLRDGSHYFVLDGARTTGTNLAFTSSGSTCSVPLVLQQARFEATSWKKYSKCPSALAEMRLLKTTAAHETNISSEPKVPEDPPQPQGQDRAASSPAQLA